MGPSASYGVFVNLLSFSFPIDEDFNAIPLFPPKDGILVEFEEQLPLKDYAIRVPMWMVHKVGCLI